MNGKNQQTGLTYAGSGVSIDQGDRLVSAIKPLAKSTDRPGVMGGLGGFGGLFDIKATGYKDPVLVSGTDGVGTKILIALEIGKTNSIGIDLVAMCVNDILAQGAEPLFFLDYLATGKLNADAMVPVIEGIAEGCRLAGAALIGGETAEMPGLYQSKDFDLAGFSLGIVERDNLLPMMDEMCPGDKLIALPSSGLHSNGFSLVRALIREKGFSLHDQAPFQPELSLGEALLAPTRIYVRELLPLIKGKAVKGLCHITGGGLIENLPRCYPKSLSAVIDGRPLHLPPVYSWIVSDGLVVPQEMLRTFNCGVGMVIIVDGSREQDVLDRLSERKACPLGHLAQRSAEGSSVTVTSFPGIGL